MKFDTHIPSAFLILITSLIAYAGPAASIPNNAPAQPAISPVFTAYTQAEKSCHKQFDAKKIACLNKNGFTQIRKEGKKFWITLNNSKKIQFKLPADYENFTPEYWEYTEDDVHAFTLSAPPGDDDSHGGNAVCIDGNTGSYVPCGKASPDRLMVASMIEHDESCGCSMITLSNRATGKLITEFTMESQARNFRWSDNQTASVELECKNKKWQAFNITKTGNKWLMPDLKKCINK